MADCNVTLNSVVLADGELDVVSKFKTLTDEALGTNSIYMRAKDTFKELFDGKKISEAEYATLASQFVSQLAVATTQQVMQGALQWAQQEKELPYSLANIKAQADATLASIERTKQEICKIQKDTELQCANITATLATSIRKNGRVATYDANNPCVPLTLMDEGTEVAQAKAIEAQKYSTLADAYRKSGVVDIATTADGVIKGVTGDNMGYTDAQEEFARRQVKSFEDSKRNHAANAISQMIGQILSAEATPDPKYVTQWDNAISYLNTNTP
jgi:hypothetical protein